MNKSEFLKAMADKGGLTLKDATTAYDAFVGAMLDALKAGEKVQLTGFANVEVRARAAREGINPATKQKISIPATRVPVLKFGKTFKESV
jgi:DNA-binding protein HU-beta